MTTDNNELREKLAAIEHERWSDWQKWVHKQGGYITVPDGEKTKTYLAIPMDVIIRWNNQIATPYYKLSNAEKASDMEQVDRYWPLIEEYITQAANKAAEAARIEPFNFVESCEPECSPERHAYHQGQWDMAVRMEAALTTEQEQK